MKRDFKEVLCIRGRGVFKAGECYALYKYNAVTGSIGFKGLGGIHSCCAYYRENCYSVVEVGDQYGARFVEVERCRKRGKEKKK